MGASLPGWIAASRTAYLYSRSRARRVNAGTSLSRHQDRAVSGTITVGAAPLDESEVDGMIEINRTEWHLMQHGDRDTVRANLRPYWEESLVDPLAGIREVLDGP
jgi:hypothetical protein